MKNFKLLIKIPENFFKIILKSKKNWTSYRKRISNCNRKIKNFKCILKNINDKKVDYRRLYNKKLRKM
jgi:hypothetical protein